MGWLLAPRFRHRIRPLGLLVVGLAMACQIAMAPGTTPSQGAGRLAALAAATVLCHGQKYPPHHPALPRQVPALAPSPVGAASAETAALLPASAAPPPSPVAVRLRIGAAALARAPPVRVMLSASPRGPPVPA